MQLSCHSKSPMIAAPVMPVLSYITYNYLIILTHLPGILMFFKRNIIVVWVRVIELDLPQ